MAGELEMGIGERLLTAMGELKAELVGQGVKLEAIQQQTTKTNGRVTLLEDRADMHDQEHRDRVKWDAGYKARRDDYIDRIETTFELGDKLIPVAAGIALGISAAVGYVWFLL